LIPAKAQGKEIVMATKGSEFERRIAQNAPEKKAASEKLPKQTQEAADAKARKGTERDKARTSDQAAGDQVQGGRR
jgi:hypothetical protein